MKNISKILIDIGPLAVFFIFYTRGDLKSSILPFMIATIIAVLFSNVILAPKVAAPVTDNELLIVDAPPTVNVPDISVFPVSKFPPI